MNSTAEEALALFPFPLAPLRPVLAEELSPNQGDSFFTDNTQCPGCRSPDHRAGIFLHQGR